MFGKFVINTAHGQNNNEEEEESSSTQGEFEEKSCFFLKRTFFVRKWFIHLLHWPYPFL